MVVWHEVPGKAKPTGDRIKMFYRRPNCTRRTWQRLRFPELGIQSVELPHFAGCSPTKIAASRLPQLSSRDLLEYSNQGLTMNFNRNPNPIVRLIGESGSRPILHEELNRFPVDSFVGAIDKANGQGARLVS